MKTNHRILLTLVSLMLSIGIPWHALAGGDPFTVKVTEKKSTQSGGGNANACLVLNDINIPCFEPNQNGTANLTFNVSFIYDPSAQPPDGTLFSSRGQVHVKDANGIEQIVTLTNAATGQNYAIGTSATSQTGEVHVSVDLNFQTLPDCGYYFTFWIDEIVPPGGPNPHHTQSRNTSTTRNGGSTTAALPYTPYPNLEATTFLTTCDPDCIIFWDAPDWPICIDDVDDNDDHHRIAQTTIASLDVYPNPSMDGNIILSADFGKAADGPMDIRVLNTQGQVVFEKHLTSQLSKQKLSLRDLPAGIYFIYALAGEQQAFEKFVKQ